MFCRNPLTQLLPLAPTRETPYAVSWTSLSSGQFKSRDLRVNYPCQKRQRRPHQSLGMKTLAEAIVFAA